MSGGLTELPAELKQLISQKLDAKSLVALARTCSDMRAHTERELDKAYLQKVAQQLAGSIHGVQELAENAKRARIEIGHGYRAMAGHLLRPLFQQLDAIVKDLTEIKRSLHGQAATHARDQQFKDLIQAATDQLTKVDFFVQTAYQEIGAIR